ncbi:MAG TPA: hypothetical protein VL359_05185, partial [bacterium]|nr:hypothetical protein [bacterium]
MLEIDYSLVPLGDKDREYIAREVARRLKAGVAPELDRSRPGRVVVVNPDPVQTEHHVPDSLRAQLRRTMLNTAEGSIALRPERLVGDILQAPEPVTVLIIEVQEAFEHLPGFLDYLPLLRAVYPDMAVFLSGTAGHLTQKLAQVLAAGNNTLVVRYGDARGTLEITDPAELSQTLIQDADVLTTSTPFFSQVRLVLERGKPPVALNLDSLRRLHPVLGFGEAKEVDVGGGRKERMVTLDIPVRLIRDFQFRQDRGLDFHGIEQNGHFIPSRRFADEKLELKWVPWRSLQAFQYKAPGGEVRRADLGRVKVLRVNCFSGQISFLTHAVGNQLSLHDTQLLAFQRQQPVELRRPEGSPIPPLGGRPLIHFDRLLLAGAQRSGGLDPVQQAVQDHYFGKLIQVEVTQARKLEIYAWRLKVGAVGPLAAQMLKLLRRYGLEKVIDPASFHYLCDMPEQLATYQNTPGRFRAHFASLLKQVKDIGAPLPSGRARLSDVNHRLPVATEWMDAASVTFDRVTPEQLAALHREMTFLSEYIGQEFQRNYDLAQEDVAFFERMRACRAVGLLARWLSDYKTGAFGARMPPGAYPDVVFFGSSADKRENDQKYFFPALACAEIFEQPANQKLFDKVDYEFGLFLEDELALAQHEAREDGVARPTLEHICTSLQTKLKEHEFQVQTLVEQAQTLDATESAEYQRLVREEEEAYHARYRTFLQDRDRVVSQHQEAAQAFLDLLLRVQERLDLPEAPDPAWLATAGPDPELFNRTFIAAAQRSAQRGREAVQAQLQGVVAGLKDALTVAHELLALSQQELRTRQTWLQSRAAEALAQAVAQVRAQQEQRRETLRRGEREDLANHLKRVHAQLGEGEAELRQSQARLAAQQLHGLRPLQQLQGTHALMQARLSKLAEASAAAEPARALAEANTQVQHVMQLTKGLLGLAERQEAGLGPLLNLAQHNQRLAVQAYEQAVDLALGRSILEPGAPELPEPPARPALQPAAQLEAQFRAQREQLASLRRRLAGLVMRFKPLLGQA